MSNSLTVIAEFETTAETFQSFLDVCHSDAERSVTDEPGCLDFVILTPHDEPNVIVLYEIYKDKVAFEEHEKAPHFAEFSDALKRLNIVTRRVRLHERQNDVKASTFGDVDC
ncbi:putative quinol monooxygenase [Saccharibacter floricola]|uniref:ABM domain-containing protein n=1 Tax=Saccharibacter floricola DSM 15669 TaxID=1123227 RepID=A0ABQ0NXN2_9PROT|nr:putative quinol monooxygenase [Saccharibacter floricola]GBQ05785.1 hypothetical protein AA15669_0631 [Saccharibacter floricola DSM 15669]